MLLRRAACGKSIKPQLQISVTVNIVGMDIDPELFHYLTRFLHANYVARVFSVERGGTLLHLHFQGILLIVAKLIVDVKKHIYHALGWDLKKPTETKVCVKKISNKGLHTFVGLVDYCMKDEAEIWSRIKMKNINDNMVRDGKELCMLMGASELKNRIYNLLSRALQFNKYRNKNPLSTSLTACLCLMLKSGKFYPSPRWLIQLGMSKARIEGLWRSFLHPKFVSPEDVAAIFFWRDKKHYDRCSGRYFLPTTVDNKAAQPQSQLPCIAAEPQPPEETRLELHEYIHLLPTLDRGQTFDRCFIDPRIDLTSQEKE